MNAGVLGWTEEDFDKIDSFVKTSNVDDTELTACVEVLRTQENAFKNYDIQVGRAAIQRLDTTEQVQIMDGSIRVSEENNVNTLYTEFLTVPGEFMVVSNGRGTFAFDLISSESPGVTIERAEINLNSLVNETENSAWQVGFYGNVSEAEKGVVYGEDIFNDEELGEIVRSCPKNQVGLNIPDEDDDLKVSITESGYLEVYQPSNYSEVQFAQFVADDVLPHLSKETIPE